MTIAFLGIDLAKNVFQLHGETADGAIIYKKATRASAVA